MEHLGGDVPGGDEATRFPDLWDWMISDLGVKELLDVGCGDGSTVDYFRSQGVHAVGVDGIPRSHEAVFTHDFTESGLDLGGQTFDAVWSSEFVEHVEERFVPNLYAAFTSAPLVFLTHAFPGQPGTHHVNCRTTEYWLGVFASWGYFLDQHLTPAAHNLAARNKSPWNHFTRSGLVLRRNEDDE